jgi:hypothetical protein
LPSAPLRELEVDRGRRPLVEGVIAKLAVTLDPMKEKVCGPAIGIGASSAVPMMNSLVYERVAWLHCDRGEVSFE